MGVALMVFGDGAIGCTDEVVVPIALATHVVVACAGQRGHSARMTLERDSISG
jgi:hypothetical protein